MNYSSVEELLSAGITNMEVIRNNSRNDDGTDSLSGVSWFNFNGTIANTIYANGNSWIGFGSKSPQLLVNNRDAALWSLYREEGTLFGFYKFLKIRWSGYQSCSSTSISDKLEYDVILWDTGDISLHLATCPTSPSGNFSLNANTTYNYTINNSQPDVTFYYNKDNTFSVVNEVINLLPPFDRKYLINSENVYYTTKNGVLEQIEITELNASSFVSHGSDVAPTWEDVQGLTNPEILCWYDTVEVKPELKASMSAVPVAQTLITDKIDLTHDSINGIEKVTVTCENELIVAVSFDEKQTWKAWNNNQWVTVSNEYAGMSKDAIESITIDQWNELYMGATSFYLRIIFEKAEQKLTSIHVDFLN